MSKSGATDRKRSVGRRLGERLRMLGQAGRDLVSQPDAVRGEAYGRFRAWFRTVWNLRGGGLYACGFAIAFVILEIREILDDVADFTGFGELFWTRLFEFAFRFAVDSLINTLYAFLWPIYVLQLAPPYGALALGLAYFLFPKYVKQHVERWLFDDKSS